MDPVFHILGSNISLAPGTRILKASDYAKVIKAQDLLTAAEQIAEDIKAKAEQAYQERYQQGYDDGVMEGRMEQAEKMLETGMQAVEYLEGLEQQIVEVVTFAVRKIIGELDERDCIVRVVRTALDQVRGRQRVLIRVCPAEEPMVREALTPMLQQVASASGLELVADQRLNKGDCILESEMGLVDASLSVQLKAIEQALKAKIVSS
ncbi:MAG: HrpE/YscL family type III secretion apparatus protein [Desulfovibrionaceae bacterium]|nr:HrpE/YscL family type III secretion apparatus protein [Desulfovibrionaceae bacterium]